MNYTVNNGSRVTVEHALYSGIAGMVEVADGAQISFPMPKKLVNPGDAIKIDGEAWQIDSVRKSATMRTMLVLSVSRKEI
jgi:hypothetical protein